MADRSFSLPRARIDADPLRSAAQVMKEAGVATTMPRMVVWRVIAQSDRPIIAMEIKRYLVGNGLDIAMSSIYAALKRLTTAELLSTCTVAGKTHYYLTSRRFRQRIVCQDSGTEHWLFDPELERAVEVFCQKHGFKMSDYTLSVQGQSINPGKKEAGGDRMKKRAVP